MARNRRWQLVLAAAAVLGAAMGALLGLAQAWALKRRVDRPLAWVWISALAWTPAMVVIFAGATIPSASWSAWVVVPIGTLTGLVAGAVLGLVSGALLRALDAAAPRLTAIPTVRRTSWTAAAVASTTAAAGLVSLLSGLPVRRGASRTSEEDP